MIKAKFSDEMINILKSMIGNILYSYECGNTIQNEAYGNLQLNLKDFSIEILNEVSEFPFYNSSEEISCFSCKKKSSSETYKTYCEEPIEKHVINEKITSVALVEDDVNVNNGEYEIRFDMAIVIKTDKHKYIFSRGWFFDEVIYITVDNEFDKVYPISKVVEDWSDDGENKINVVRTVRKL